MQMLNLMHLFLFSLCLNISIAGHPGTTYYECGGGNILCFITKIKKISVQVGEKNKYIFSTHRNCALFSCGATQYTTLCVCVCVLRFCYDHTV